MQVIDSVSEFERQAYIDNFPFTSTPLHQTIFSYFPYKVRNEPG